MDSKSKTVDVLKSILRICDSLEYYDNFKSNNIGINEFNIICDEDLQVVGIQDEEKRQKLLSKLKNIGIPAEKKIDLTVDKQYAQSALNEISTYLETLNALLTCAAKREDTVICDVRLTPAVNCLKNILYSLEEQLDSFEFEVFEEKRKWNMRRKLYISIPALSVATLALFYCRRYIST